MSVNDCVRCACVEPGCVDETQGRRADEFDDLQRDGPPQSGPRLPGLPQRRRRRRRPGQQQQPSCRDVVSVSTYRSRDGLIRLVSVSSRTKSLTSWSRLCLGLGDLVRISAMSLIPRLHSYSSVNRFM